MSRLGKKPIELPEGVEVKLNGSQVQVKGPKGQLSQDVPAFVTVNTGDKEVTVSVDKGEDRKQKAFWGLYRSLIRNMVEGVSQGFEKKLEVNGVGYRASGSGSKLNLNLGFSHPIDMDMPEGITANVDGKIITISGIDKQLVGETAARIRRLRPPEPYKGKGIRYIDEIVRRKEGKTAASK